MVFGESRSKDRARKRAAGKLLSVLLTVAMVLQGSPFAYAEEILAAMDQEDAVTPAVVEEPAAEEPVAADAIEESVAEDATEEAAPAEAEAMAIEEQDEAEAEPEPSDAVGSELVGGTAVQLVPAAEDALTLSLNLYDYDDETTIAFPSDFSSDNIYAFVYVDIPGVRFIDLPEGTPWAAVDMNAVKGADSPHTEYVSSFSTAKWHTGNPVSYSSLSADQKQNLRVRVIHTNEQAPSLGSLQNKAQYEQAQFEELWNGGFDGYDLSKAHPTSTKPSDTGDYEVNFVKGNTLKHDVVLRFDPADDRSAIESGKYYVLLDATSVDGNNHYYYVVEAVADGESGVVHLPVEGNWSSGQKFSNNWKDIKASIITPKDGATIETGGNKPDKSTYNKSYTIDDYIYSYDGRETETDEEQHIQYDEFVITLRRANFEKAIDPYDVLGEGAEFGVVAKKYIQDNDSETNFAAKVFENKSGDALKVGEKGAAGDAVAPFYVGKVEGTNNLRLGQGITVDCDVYINENQQDRVVKDNDPNYDLNKYPMSESAIDAVVDGYIQKLKASSAEYAGKKTITPTYDSGEDSRNLDTTMLPDGITIYVDARNMNLASGGGTIYKLPGQTIVFNIPGSDVRISQFYVQEMKQDGTPIGDPVFSNTDPQGGDPAKNKRIEEAILNHIVFNAPDASVFEVNSGPAGLFLAPKDGVKVSEPSGSGTGWIATAGEFHQKGGEWHFFRTQRKYKAKGDLTLKAQKKLTDASGNVIEYEDKGFEFELYEADDQFNPAKDAEGNVKPALDTETADADGFVEFEKLKYDHTKVPAGQTRAFYYVIKEVIPPDAVNAAGHTYAQASEEEKAAGGFVKDGIEYKAEDIKVMVEATAPEEGSGSEEITFEVTANGKKIEDTGTGDEKVFEIGEFKNSKEQMGSLKITKNVTVAGQPVTEKTPASLKNLADGTYKFEVYKGESATGTPEKSVELTITNGVSSTQLVEELEPGKYTIKEVAGGTGKATLTDPTSGIITVDVAAGKTGDDIVVASFINDYSVKGEAALKIKKALGTGNTWPEDAKVTFTLSGNGGTLPSTTAIDVSDTNEHSFDPITYGLADAGKTYTYTVKETGTFGDDWTVEPADGITATVEVGAADDLNADGTLKTTITYSPNDFTITNTKYEGKVQFHAKKTENEKLDGKTFYVNLRGDGITGTITKAITQGQTIDFEEIVYNLESLGSESQKTFTYHISEADGIAGGVTYDKAQYKVVVTLKKVVGQSNLVNSVKYYKIVDKTETEMTGDNIVFVFTNSYAASGQLVLSGTKKIESKPESMDLSGFKFTVKEGGETVATGESDAQGKITFDAIAYPSIESVGEHTYEVTEDASPTKPGVTNSTSTVTVKVNVADDGEGGLVATATEDSPAGIDAVNFTNAYEAKGNVTFEGTKKIEGRDLTADDKFTFTVTEGDTLVAEVTNDATGKIAYPTIEYVKNKDKDETGLHTYTVKETSTDGSGITVDTTTYTVTVDVQDVDHNGALTVTPSENYTKLDFTNAYEAKGSITLEGTKTIDTREIAEGETFSFEIRDNKGTVVSKGKSDGKKITFEPIEYVKNKDKDQTGTFTYSVVETSADGKGITTDKKSHKAVVKVTDNGKGELVVELVEDKSDINFVNKYDAAGSFQIAGLTKVLKNGELKAKQFSFQLKDADGKVLQTAYNDDSGNITFSAISYTLADLKGAASKKFSYTVNEVVPAGATKNADGTYTAGGITYSGDVVSFEVTVSDNGDGTLKIEGAEGGKVDLKHVFVNSQQEKKQAEKKKLAKTSDLANPGLMAGIAGAGLAIVVIGLINRRRRRDQ